MFQHDLRPFWLVRLALLLLATLSMISMAYPLDPPAKQQLRVLMTAYSSTEDQTDSTPFLTSTLTTVRPGIVAVSRDLLSTHLPYGSRLRLMNVQSSPNTCGGWDINTVLEVQDTMHRRKRNQIDIWMPSRQEALEWGRCHAVVEVITKGDAFTQASSPTQPTQIGILQGPWWSASQTLLQAIRVATGQPHP